MEDETPVEPLAAAPNREPRRRPRGRRLRAAVAAVSVAAVTAVVYLLVGPSPAAQPSSAALRLTAVQKAPSPSTFVLATSHRFGYQLGIYSASTGSLVRQLATFPSRFFTNNGLAYSSDGRAVYFTLIPRQRSRQFGLRLMRLDTATRRSSFVVDGAQPALNQTGSELAYAAFPRGLAVRNLRTGETRTIALGELDTSANLINATVGWLADGSDIAVVPGPTAWDLVGRRPHFRWCGTSQRTQVIVFVHVPPPPAALSAKCIRLPGAPLDGRVTLAPDPASTSSVLATTTADHGGTLVEQISQTGAVAKVVTIPDSLSLAFDAHGTHLLYLAGHKSPTLTEATISKGRATNGPWHDRHIELGAAAW